jgi:hypothetical protein
MIIDKITSDYLARIIAIRDSGNVESIKRKPQDHDDCLAAIKHAQEGSNGRCTCPPEDHDASIDHCRCASQAAKSLRMCDECEQEIMDYHDPDHIVIMKAISGPWTDDFIVAVCCEGYHQLDA